LLPIFNGSARLACGPVSPMESLGHLGASIAGHADRDPLLTLLNADRCYAITDRRAAWREALLVGLRVWRRKTLGATSMNQRHRSAAT